MKTTFIYGLKDPVTNIIRYIGKTNNLKQRLKAHLNPARYKPTHKFNWIKKLREKGLKPTIEIIEEVDIKVWHEKEKYWILFYKNNNLVNCKEGGEGLTFANNTSFKKGHKSWNEGKGNIKICIICHKEFKSAKSAKKKSCSKECASIVRRDATKNTQFKKGTTPWNKNLKYEHNKK